MNKMMRFFGFFVGAVAALLGLGFIPVLHGDGVLDDVKVRVWGNVLGYMCGWVC
jgi:isopentenyl phosphate kinase